MADAGVVSLLEEAVRNRSWWAENWAEGAPYLVGLVAQDVQDSLLGLAGRWPLCTSCEDAAPHALYVHPDLGGPDPVWVCEQAGIEVAPVGGLSPRG